MAKRKILTELIEGVEAMKDHREGELTLRSYRVELTPFPTVASSRVRPSPTTKAANSRKRK